MLDALNSLTPGDSGVERVVRGIRYGEAPRQQLDIWSLPRKGEEQRPVLVFFYGGGWVKGRRQDYGFAAKAYAARDFVVVVPDYRLVPQVVFPVFLEDAAEAVGWVHRNIARYGGDPQRISFAGHSAGAYAAVMLALNGDYLAAHGVDPQAVRASVGLAGPYDFYPFTGRAVAAMGSAPDPMATQPIRFARADAPPLWLAHGSEDKIVRPRNSIRLAKRMEQLGGDATLRMFPGLDHEDVIMAVSKPFRGKAPVLQESVDFLTAHSQPQAAAAPVPAPTS